MNQKISIEKIDNYKEVELLYKIVYANKETHKFEWLYKKNPSGRADIFIARDQETNTVIASYTVIPMRIWFEDREMLIGQAIDGMVHPDYRKKQVFNRIIKKALTHLKNRYELLIGFPNNMSVNSLLKANWKTLGHFVTYSLPLKTEVITKTFFKKALTKKLLYPLINPSLRIYIEFHRKAVRTKRNCSLIPLKKDDIEVKRIQKQIIKINSILTVRDIPFVKWRFQINPHNNYIFLQYLVEDNFKGYIILKHYCSSVEIIDFFITPVFSEQVQAIKLLIDYCTCLGYKIIHFQLSEYSYCCKAFKKMGFFKRKIGTSIIIYPISEITNTIKYKSCFLTTADTDWI